MAIMANPRKGFNFRIEIDGIDQAEVQKLTIPDVEIEQVEHGDVNHTIKTPGKVAISNIVLEKLKRMPGSDVDAWTWLSSAQSQVAGGGLLAEVVKKIIIVKEMDTTGLVSLNRHVFFGCWVTKISQSTFDRMSSDNMIQTIEISVDKYQQL